MPAPVMVGCRVWGIGYSGAYIPLNGAFRPWAKLCGQLVSGVIRQGATLGVTFDV